MDSLVDIMPEPSPNPCFDQLGGPQTATTGCRWNLWIGCCSRSGDLDQELYPVPWRLDFKEYKDTPWKREIHGDWQVISRHTTYTQTDMNVVRFKKLEVEKCISRSCACFLKGIKRDAGDLPWLQDVTCTTMPLFLCLDDSWRWGL